MSVLYYNTACGIYEEELKGRYSQADATTMRDVWETNRYLRDLNSNTCEA